MAECTVSVNLTINDRIRHRRNTYENHVLNLNQTVATLKETFLENCGIPVSQQTWVIGGDVANDRMKLSYYRIHNNDAVTLVLETESLERTTVSEVGEEWRCSTCTFINFRQLPGCEQCMTENPEYSTRNDSSPGPVLEDMLSDMLSESWNCGECTFKNSSALSICEMCRHPNPGQHHAIQELPDPPEKVSYSLHNFSEPWTCKSCSYINFSVRPGCEMCSAASPYQADVQPDVQADVQPLHHVHLLDHVILPQPERLEVVRPEQDNEQDGPQ